ncbi:MAG TPA: hypothetical protein VHE35_11235 [Kofleriaceae bacterium]|nr:hypothetical protein [Kofleriaceae bacterium]
MHVPQWLALVIAAAVVLYGIYRIHLATGGPSDEERGKERRGLYAVPRWHHGLVGAILVLAGGALIASALGWNPIAGTRRATAPAPVGPGGRPPTARSNAVFIDGALVVDPRVGIKPTGSPPEPAPAAPPAGAGASAGPAATPPAPPPPPPAAVSPHGTP